MSVTAQRQDITDPGCRASFRGAGRGSRTARSSVPADDRRHRRHQSEALERPGRISLLADLYVATRYALRAGLERPPHAEARVGACRERVRCCCSMAGLDRARAQACWMIPDDELPAPSPGTDRAADARDRAARRNAPGRVDATPLAAAAARCSCTRPIATDCSPRSRPRSIARRDRSPKRACCRRNGMAFDTFVVLDADTDVAARCAAMRSSSEAELASRARRARCYPRAWSAAACRADCVISGVRRASNSRHGRGDAARARLRRSARPARASRADAARSRRARA